MHLAALQGRLGVIKQLLDARAPANAADEHGMTPLHKAAVGGRAEACQLLLDAGASLTAQLKVGPASPSTVGSTLSFSLLCYLAVRCGACTCTCGCVRACAAHQHIRSWAWWEKKSQQGQVVSQHV